MNIINPDVVEILKENFTSEQIREISFAFNPDCADITDTICKIEEGKIEYEEMIMDLKERLKEVSEQMSDISDLIEDME